MATSGSHPASLGLLEKKPISHLVGFKGSFIRSLHRLIASSPDWTSRDASSLSLSLLQIAMSSAYMLTLSAAGISALTLLM